MWIISETLGLEIVIIQKLAPVLFFNTTYLKVNKITGRKIENSRLFYKDFRSKNSAKLHFGNNKIDVFGRYFSILSDYFV